MREVKMRSRLGAVLGEPPAEAPPEAKPAPAPEARQIEEIEAPVVVARGQELQKQQPASPRMGKKQRLTLWVTPETCDALRDAIYACPRQVTVADVAEEALIWAIKQLEQRYNDGRPFPHRPEDAKQLPSGRPVK